MGELLRKVVKVQLFQVKVFWVVTSHCVVVGYLTVLTFMVKVEVARSSSVGIHNTIQHKNPKYDLNFHRHSPPSNATVKE
jgi:hypothetical protein